MCESSLDVVENSLNPAATVSPSIHHDSARQALQLQCFDSSIVKQPVHCVANETCLREFNVATWATTFCTLNSTHNAHRFWSCRIKCSVISKYVRTALFWTNTQKVVVIPYRRFGTTYRSHLYHMKMGQIGCVETSVRNCHYSLRNSLEERSSELLRGGSLKPPTNVPVWRFLQSNLITATVTKCT